MSRYSLQRFDATTGRWVRVATFSRQYVAKAVCEQYRHKQPGNVFRVYDADTYRVIC